MSEIAKIRERIDLEIEAMRQAQGYAIVARHDIITHHYDQLGDCYEQLAAEIGEKRAIAELAEQIERLL
jgi:hypothetical protein